MYDCSVQHALSTPKFTGKERDSESGLDNFGARYYGSSLGRFETADPLPWLRWHRGNSKDRDRFTALLVNPQNLNLYAYVLNNPLNKTDPTGMYQCGGTAEQCAGGGVVAPHGLKDLMDIFDWPNMTEEEVRSAEERERTSTNPTTFTDSF